ncbi:MAG: DNA-directed RNA polymerase subunit H [Candidatus Aenigmatarchaeota archaeon]
MKEIDIRKHELVPKHILLNENQKEELLRKYNITLKQLPRILASDPVIKIINAQPGDVVMIERNSLTAGKIDYYRVVIKG